MKIHIVQKGDTLWKLAQKYGVDFEEMKQMNNHLADSDMLMQGMKVKIPSTAVQAKKELPKKEMPKKLAPLKKEIPKVENLLKKGAPQELPKKEMQKVEAIMDTPKKGLPKKELPKIGDILDDLKPLVKELLHEMKPEIINEIKIDLQMIQVNEKNKYSFQEVKPFKPLPPPAPKVQMPVPYMSDDKPKVSPLEHPCPPYPKHIASKGHHMGNMQGYNSGYGVGPMIHPAPWQAQPYQAPVQSWQQPQHQAPNMQWQQQGWNQQSPATYPSSLMPGTKQGMYGMPTGHHPAHIHPHHQHITPRSNEEDSDETRVN